MRRWSHLVPPGARVLDLACGAGRHLRWFAERGARVTGVDRNAAALDPLRGLGEIVVADLEAGPWPLAGRRFDAVVVANYLWRPRFAELVANVDVGGLLICETFAVGQGTIGRPSNPAFLLRASELLELVAPLRTIAFEDGFDPPAPDAEAGPGRFVQRIVAVREGRNDAAEPARLPLAPAAGGAFPAG